MPSCSVKWCSNHTSTCSLKSKNGVSFHRFPKDEATCQKWVEAVRYERRDPWWTSSNASRICSIHFKETDISSTPCKVNILAKTAVPVCTMVWYDENENNTTSKTFNVRTNTEHKIKPIILKTYERKKTNMNVLKELKVNMSYNRNKEGTAMSQTNSVVISNTTPCLSQDNSPQATKLLKTLEVSKTLNLRDSQESNSIFNISSKTSANANVREAQKNTVLTESNKKEYVKSCKKKCCKSKILVKINDNTSLILDEDWSNESTSFRDSNKVSKEPNLITFENSRNVNLKEFKSNENKEPTEITNISNADVFVKAITNGNVELNANISKSYVGKMLRTYLPKRKDTASGKDIRDTSKLLKKNKSLGSITMKKGLNTVKEVNNTNVNKHPKGDFSNKLKIRVCYKNNIIADLQSKANPQEKKQPKLLNVKKYTFKKASNLLNRPRFREKKTVCVDPNKDANKESNIAHIDEFITNQSRIDNIKDTAVYDEMISELFETSKNVENVSNLPSSDNYQVSNENVCTDHNMDKGSNNRNVILDLDTNIYRALNTLMDLELCHVDNTGTNGENVEVNTDKTAISENFTQFNEHTMSESHQQMVINNENMYSNKNINNNAILLPSNELQNLETIIERNIFPETKKEKFTELKKYLSMLPKRDSPSQLCTTVLTHIDNNIFSRYDNISSTSLTKENLQVSNRDHSAEFNKNIDIDVNDMVTSIQSNINTDTTKETETNITRSKQLNPILFEEFINNIAPESNKSENMDFITNFNTDPNTTRDPEFTKIYISGITVECKKNIEKDMSDLDTFMNLESCSEVNIGLNEINIDKTGINVDFRDYNENTATESNQKLSMEHGDHLIPIAIESDYQFRTEMNGYTQFNKNMCYNENIINNAKILSNNELRNLETSVSNIVTETNKDNFTELNKYLFTKPNLDFAEFCTNSLIETTLSDSTMPMAIIKENILVPDRSHNAQIDKNTNTNVNEIVTSSENNMNTDVNKETELILLEELITNTIPELNNNNFNNNLKTDQNTTRPYLNEKEISDSIECNKSLEKDMPELNSVILSELNEDQVIKSKEVMNRKFYHLNTEMNTDKKLLLLKSQKDTVNVLETSDDQHTAVNEHMDVVDSILNRDIAAEFDLSLLLSDTPIPDEEIQNLDNNSNNNSLDGIVGSPNWIQLPNGEMPKIIDDILDQGSPFFENLDLFDKANKFNIDKEANKKDNEIKKLMKEKSTSNFEQLKEQIINTYCENGKQCTKNSIAQIEKQDIAEISDYNETSLKQRNNNCSENKDIQSEKVTAAKCYDLCDEQTDKQILEQYIQSNNEQCEKFNIDQIIDKHYENRDKEIEVGNNAINQCQQNDVDSKPNQIEEPTSNQYFEQSEKLHREPDVLGGIANSNYVDTFKPSDKRKKQSDKQSNEPKNQSCVGKPITVEQSIPKSKVYSQGTVESYVQEINSKLFKDCNEKRIEEVNNVSNEAHTVDTESVRELNIGQLMRAIFEECYDPECGNDCKNQIHNSNTESHKKDDEQYEKQTNYTACQPDIEKRKRRLLYKRQCYQTSTDNLKKHLKNSSFDQNTKEMKNKSFLDRQKLSHNEKYKTKYKKIAIDHIPGQYLELRWKESGGKSNSQEGCKRKHKELGLDQRKMLCSQSTNIFSQQIMAECPECGYTTKDTNLINDKSDVDLTITKPLSLINKDLLISLHDVENENNNQNNDNNNRVALESVYAMELAYVTAIQAMERKLKQKIAISEYRLRRVNNLSQINNQLSNLNITLMDLVHKNKV